MLFSSLTFVLFFLPANVLITRFLNTRQQNVFLLFSSLLFYAWGEPTYILLMLFSITFNWLMGLGIDRCKSKPALCKGATAFAVVFNLGLLFYYKYFNFFIASAAKILPIDTNAFAEVALPLGISFYTFQSISYIVDLYRGKCGVQKSWVNVSLYISFFPQLVAGPIIKYNDVNLALSNRTVTSAKTAYGIKRFVYGLGKKVILSNYFAYVVDQIYAVEVQHLSTASVWLAAVLYALQIYYDFGGYSDMAIGIGSMFGFHFPENFNYPYVSSSVQEFWRRWHISLSTWFKEYLYIPLGGNRRGSLRTYINLLIVFFCTGFWHGASWQFVAWGLFHGCFLVLERVYSGKHLKNPRYHIIGTVYTLTEVITAFVIFRAPGLRYAMRAIRAMFIPTAGSGIYPAAVFIDAKLICFMLAGIVLCGFLQEKIPSVKRYLMSENVHKAELVWLPIIYIFCLISLVSNTYNPFIYFRF